MKNQKMTKATSLAHRRRLQGLPFATKFSPGAHRVSEAPDLHKCKSVRFSGHPLKPELAGLIEKTLQEAEVSGTEGEAQSTDEDISCLKVIKREVCDQKKDNSDEQDESVTVETGEKKEAKAESEMEEVVLEIKKDLSSFVEIDLRDKVEQIQKTEEILTEEKQNEEESPEIISQSSWLCCFPYWMKQKKQKEKQE